MKEIIVKHNHIIITDYDMGDCPSLERQFSIWDERIFKLVLRILEYNEEKRELIVPRGVDISYLEGLIGVPAKIDFKHDPVDKIDKVLIKYKPKDDVQREALSFMQGEKNYKFTQRHSQLSVNLNTGAGKTYCCVVNSARFRTRSIVITSSIDWLNQWKDAILEHTDTKAREVFMLVGSPSIHRILKADMSQYKYILASHDTIRSYGERFGWEKVGDLFKHLKVGCKYYDEAHLNFDNMAKIDAYTNTQKTYYVTATPKRSDEDENKLFGYYLKNVPGIDLFDEEEDPRTKYIALRYNSRPSPVDISNCRNPYGFDRNKYSSYIIQQENFYYMAEIVINIAINLKGKSVFYIATNDSIDILYEWIMDTYPELRGNVGVFNSRVDPSIKSSQLEKKIILSTTKSLGTAQDISGLEMCVVLAEPFKSEVTARQTLGRTRARDTLYIEVVDNGFKPIAGYYRHKLPIFNKYATSTSVINMTDKQLYDKANDIREKRYIKLQNMYGLYFNDGYITPMIVHDENMIRPMQFDV